MVIYTSKKIIFKAIYVSRYISHLHISYYNLQLYEFSLYNQLFHFLGLLICFKHFRLLLLNLFPWVSDYVFNTIKVVTTLRFK